MTRTKYRNRCLAYLPDADLAILERWLSPVTFEIQQVLYQQQDRIERIVFLETGLVSLITHMADGDESESLTIGPDGAVGIMGAIGTMNALRRAVVSVEGEGWAIPVAELRAAVADRPAIREMASRAAAASTAKLLQSVACNARHGLEQRFARRLLACSDASRAKRFALTQDGLADTLGVRRTSVTATAKALRQSGLIGYRHGRIWIEDAAGLAARACECRAVINAETERLLPPNVGSGGKDVGDAT